MIVIVFIVYGYFYVEENGVFVCMIWFVGMFGV